MKDSTTGKRNSLGRKERLNLSTRKVIVLGKGLCLVGDMVSLYSYKFEGGYNNM